MTNSSVADPVEAISGLPGLLGENVIGLAYFPLFFFSQLCNSHTSLKGLQSLRGSLPKSGPLDFATKNTFPLFFVGEEALVGIY